MASLALLCRFNASVSNIVLSFGMGIEIRIWPGSSWRCRRRNVRFLRRLEIAEDGEGGGTGPKERGRGARMVATVRFSLPVLSASSSCDVLARRVGAGESVRHDSCVLGRLATAIWHCTNERGGCVKEWRKEERTRTSQAMYINREKPLFTTPTLPIGAPTSNAGDTHSRPLIVLTAVLRRPLPFSVILRLLRVVTWGGTRREGPGEEAKKFDSYKSTKSSRDMYREK